MHDNVVFEANTAGANGGAVSLLLENGFHLAIVVFSDRCCEARVDLIHRGSLPSCVARVDG